MALLGLAIGIVFVATGVVAAAAPRIVASAMEWESPRGRRISVALRLAIGIALILAALSSRFPELLRFLGVAALLGAVVFASVPDRQWAELMRFWLKDHLAAYRVLSAVVLIPLGCFIGFGAIA